ncbi:hypothetical protein D9M70_561760 [compost metagenome]
MEEQVEVAGGQAQQLFDELGDGGVAIGDQLGVVKLADLDAFLAGQLRRRLVAGEDVHAALGVEVQLQAEVLLAPRRDVLLAAGDDGHAE